MAGIGFRMEAEMSNGDGSGAVGGFFSTLGSINIWLNIIFMPIVVGVLVWAIVVVQRYERGWKTDTAILSNEPCLRPPRV